MPKKKRAFSVQVEEELYREVSVKSIREGWKVAGFLRKVLKRLAGGDELAEAILKEHLIDEQEGRE